MARVGRNTAAFERTLTALRAGGRIEAVDAALIAAGRTLARLVDDRDEPVAGVVWPYLSVLKELRGVAGDDNDALAELAAAMRGPLGDAPES